MCSWHTHTHVQLTYTYTYTQAQQAVGLKAYDQWRNLALKLGGTGATLSRRQSRESTDPSPGGGEEHFQSISPGRGGADFGDDLVKANERRFSFEDATPEASSDVGPGTLGPPPEWGSDPFVPPAAS